jgi:hypothetical protein
LTKLVINTITIDINKTATGGAVIVPPDYSVIEFISPDNHIDYAELLTKTFGEALTDTAAILQDKPVPAWDKFVTWINDLGVLNQFVASEATFELQTIDGTYSTIVNPPDFTNLSNTASLLVAINNSTTNMHDQPLSTYQIDTKAFGWALKVSATDSEGNVTSFAIGFMFRE